jgi:hypothetical protein
MYIHTFTLSGWLSQEELWQQIMESQVRIAPIKKGRQGASHYRCSKQLQGLAKKT